MIKQRRDMSDLERKQARALAELKYMRGSPFAGFAREMARLADERGPKPHGVTEGQAAQLSRLAWSRRDDLPQDIRPLVNPYV